MAVARGPGQSGISAIHVWLIAFVALWLTSTVLLVILYLDQEDIKSLNEELRAENSKLVSPQGRKLPQFAEAQRSSLSVVDVLEQDRAETSKLAGGGDGSEGPLAVREKLTSLVDRLEANPHVDTFGAETYYDALDSLIVMYEEAVDSLDSSIARADELAATLDKLRAAQEQQKQEFADETKNVKDRLGDIEQEQVASQQQHARQVDDFGAQIEQINEQCTESIQAERNENEKLRGEYAELQARYQELKDKLGRTQISPVPLATARHGDGVVLKAIPGDDEVIYIDLGRENHLTLGLEFSVYDALTGIPANGEAKARIEVVRLHENSAECMVSWKRPGAGEIAEGDIIANLIYDPGQSLRFFVLGEFDFDKDMRADVDGAERVEALIKEWGGTVASELSAQVDFVVLGAAPELVARSPDLDREEDTRYQNSRERHDNYLAQRDAVMSMSIPVLPQSVFLAFLGETEVLVSGY